MGKLKLVKIASWYTAGNIESKIFLITAALFGSLFVLASAPMQAPDESSHYYRAYQLSRLDLRADYINGRYGYLVPTEVRKISETFLAGESPKAKLDKSTLQMVRSINDYSGKVPVYFENTAIYSPTVYIPQMFALRITQQIRLPIVLGFYFTRFVTLFFYIMLIYFALRLMPIGRKTMLALSLLPMSLYLGSSINADASIIGFSFLSIALILHLIIERKITYAKTKITIFILIISLLALSKNGFLAFTLLYFLIPGNYFKNKKYDYLVKISAIVFVTIVTLIWNRAVYEVASTIHSILKPGAPIDTAQQIKHIIREPISFLGALLNTLFLKSSALLSMSFIGIFGWLDIVLPFFCYLIAPIILFYASCLDRNYINEKCITLKTKLIFFITASLVASILLLSLYLGYSELSSNFIDGVQGRYFIPISVLIIPLICKNRNVKKQKLINLNTPPLFIASIQTLLITSVITLFIVNS